MTESAGAETQHPTRLEKSRRSLVSWFGAGFLLVFFTMLIFLRGYSMHPSGGAAMSTPLWQYYLIQINQSLHSSGHLGPTTGSGGTALTTFLQHLLCSAIGGVVMFGIGWVVRKNSQRGSNNKK